MSVPPRVTPQHAAGLLKDRLLGDPFTCCIHGPFGSGKSTTLAEIVWIACDLGLSLNRFAVYAPHYPALRHLRSLIGWRWPELNPQFEIFYDMAGTPDMAYRHFSMEPGGPHPPSLGKLADGYLLKIATANNLEPTPVNADWLMKRKPEVIAAIKADLNARLEHQPLPRIAYLHLVADHVAEHKRQRQLLDRADVINGSYRIAPEVKLLLLDQVRDHDRDLLARYFPNASIIFTSLQSVTADVSIHLPSSLRQPERQEIRESDPQPSQVPPPAHFQSLSIVTAPWRIGKWLWWLREHGFPPPDWPRWRSAVAAWKLDQDAPVRASAINPLLSAVGLAPEEDEPVVFPGDVIGWTNWRDMVDRFDPIIREHADAVLDRYGRLFPLPTVTVGSEARLLQCEAEVVIADTVRASTRLLAESRARDRLIVLEKRN